MDIKKNQAATQRIMISLNEKTAEMLEKIAKKYNVTKSNVITILITKYASKEFEIEQGSK